MSKRIWLSHKNKSKIGKPAPSPFRKKPTAKSVNKKVKKIMNRQELNHVDVNFAGTAFGTTVALTLLNGVAVGDADTQMEGHDFNMTSVQMRATVQSDPQAIIPTTCRILIVYDKQPNKAAPTSSDVLDVLTITPYIDAPYNRDNQKRFKIIYDKIVTLNPQVPSLTVPATGVVTDLVSVSKYLKVKRSLNKIVKKSGNTAAISDIVTGSLYLLLVSNSNTEQPVFTGGTRVYFKDN